MRWRNIHEERPAERQECLISDGTKVSAGVYEFKKCFADDQTVHWSGCNCGGYDFEFLLSRVTHWLPLAEIPAVPNAPAQAGAG